MIRVRVIASTPALRAGLISMLSSDADISISEDGPVESDQSPAGANLDVILLARSPNAGQPLSADATPPNVPVLLLRNDPLEARTLLSGPNPCGVLPLDASAAEIRAGVRALAAGLIVADPSLIGAMNETSATGGPLTDRETEVLGLLSRGLANKQIAVALGISEHTVKFHVSSIYTKLNATNRTQAVREGLRNGWIAL